MHYEIIEGDITEVDTEVIVNAWNRNIIPWFLLITMGVSGAIKRKSGFGPFNQLLKRGPMPLGTAQLTDAGKLPYKGIIHVAGINMLWQACERSIRDSVRSAIAICNEQGFQSVAFPVIGAGSGSFNHQQALDILTDQLAKEQSDCTALVVVYPQ